MLPPSHTPSSGSSIKYYHPKNGTVIYSHQANTGIARPVRDGDSVRFYWLNNGSSSTFIHDVDLLHIHPNWTIEYHSYSKTLPANIGAPTNWDSEGFRNVVPAIYKISGYGIDFVANYSIYVASGGGFKYRLSGLVHPISQQFGSNLYVVDNDSDGHHFYDDIFPDEPSQFADVDGDGFGDNSSGFEGDACPNVAGNSTLDYYGCLDNDGDGYSYLTDSFRTDPTQWNDTDGDGFGDRLNGNSGDSCPSVAGSSFNNNTFGCPDSDFDGWADTDDASGLSPVNGTIAMVMATATNSLDLRVMPAKPIAGNSSIDRYGCLDSDGDGYSDL